MSAMSEVSPTAEELEGGPEHFECDFCGETVLRVRRIALDGDYDRLQQPHPVQFACDRCSEEKERRRLDIADG
jgi:hypothetical protein